MFENISETLSIIFMCIGTFFMLSGSLGILRMPDFFTRLHPAGVTDSMGAPMILLGVIVHYGFSLVSAKIFFIILLLLLANPTATHTLAQTALVAKLKPLTRKKK